MADPTRPRSRLCGRCHTGTLAVVAALATGAVAAAAAAENLASHYRKMQPPISAAFLHIHDPSRVITDAGRQYIAATGKAQKGGYRCGLELWSRRGPAGRWQPDRCLFIRKPAWIHTVLPDQDGAFWAPDFLDNRYLFYSVSLDADRNGGSCIGVATARGRPGARRWSDSGRPLTCAFTAPGQVDIAAIDPTPVRRRDGRIYLVAGGGVVHGTELDRRTLRPVSGDWYHPDHPGWASLARGPRLSRGGYDWVEAPYVHARGGWFYLFVNWGACCHGVNSTYQIRVGRARHPLGPYRDRTGRSLLDGGGTLVLAGAGRRRGPGHAGIWRTADGTDRLTFHFYDTRRDGLPWIGELPLRWQDGWPVAAQR